MQKYIPNILSFFPDLYYNRFGCSVGAGGDRPKIFDDRRCGNACGTFGAVSLAWVLGGRQNSVAQQNSRRQQPLFRKAVYRRVGGLYYYSRRADYVAVRQVKSSRGRVRL